MSDDERGPLRRVTEPLLWLRRLLLPKAAADIPLLPSAEHTVLIALAALIGLYAGLAATLLRAMVDLGSAAIAFPDAMWALIVDDGSQERIAFAAELPKGARYREILAFAGLGLVLFGGAGLIRDYRRRKALLPWHRMIRFSRLPRLLIIALLLGVAGLTYVGLTVLVAAGHAMQITHGRLLEAFDGTSFVGLALIAVVGGLLTGVATTYLDGANGHGVPDIMEAVALNGGALSAKRGLSYASASALTAASLGSVGLEGPVVFFGASTASGLGQTLRLSRGRLRVLAAAGAAAGISASFNAPIAGALFALEIIVGDFALTSFSPVVIASVVGAVVNRSIVGDAHVFSGVQFSLLSGYEIFLYVGLGLFTGVVGALFVKSIEGTGEFSARVFARIPPMLRPALAFLFLVVAAKLLGRPEFLGSGHDAMHSLLAHPASVVTLVSILVGKIVATSLTLGAGGVGGVMFPSLLLGGAAGSLYGTVVERLFGGLAAGPTSYAVVGMGALLTAVQHAPLTATVMVFEFTNNSAIILPLLVACIVSTLLSTRALGGNVYERSLRRRGVVISRGKEVNVLRSVKVKDAMRTDVPSLRASTKVSQLPTLLRGTSLSTFPLVDDGGNLEGVISLQDLRDVMLDPENNTRLTAIDLGTKNVVTLTPDDDLEVAMSRLALQPFEHIVVVDAKSPLRVVGLLAAQDVLGRYTDALKRAGLAELEGESDAAETGEFEAMTDPPQRR